MGCLSNVVAMAKGPRGWQRRQNDRRGEQRGAVQHSRLVSFRNQAEGTRDSVSVGGESRQLMHWGTWGQSLGHARVQVSSAARP